MFKGKYQQKTVSRAWIKEAIKADEKPHADAMVVNKKRFVVTVSEL
jgi:hypothetical protein